MAGVGIVIVTCNSEAEIGPCLDAALPAGDVIVVDNTVNRGFAAAVNQGIRAIDSDVVLLLNPDAVLKTSIEPLRLACAAPKTGAVAGKILGSDNLVQAGFN